MHTVQCIVYTIHCTVYSVYFTLYSVQHVLYLGIIRMSSALFKLLISVIIDFIPFPLGDFEELKSKYKNKISEFRKENSLLKSSLDEKLSKVKLLEFQLKTAKADNFESVQKKDILIKSLQTELEGKSDQLAYLMSKLHSAKVIQMRVPSSSEQAADIPRFSPTPPPIRRTSPRPLSRGRSIDFSKSRVADPLTSAAVEILSEQEQKALIVNKSVPLPAIGDPNGSRSFLSKLKFNRNRNGKVSTVLPKGT